jgi:hypothetical protein
MLLKVLQAFITIVVIMSRTMFLLLEMFVVIIVAFVDNVGNTENIHNSCGTGPDVHVNSQLGKGDFDGDNDNGSPSPCEDNGFDFGWLNNIEFHEFAAVGNVGGGHAINNNHFGVAVVNNVGNTEYIIVGDVMGLVDIVAALNRDTHDVAILQLQRTSSQQPEIVGNTNINNENQEQGGDDSVDNVTRQARENSDTGH